MDWVIEDGDSVWNNPPRHQFYDLVVDAIEGLTPEEQTVVNEHVWHRSSFAEIGDLMGYSKAHAHRVWQRALGKLGVNLADLYEEVQSEDD